MLEELGTLIWVLY